MSQSETCKTLESLGEAKIKQLPTWFQSNITKARVNTIVAELSASYRSKYFTKKGKIAPLVHTMLAVGLLGYTLNFDHIAHDRNRKYH